MKVRELAGTFGALAQNARLHSDAVAAEAFQAIAEALARQRAKLDVHEALEFWRGCSPRISPPDSIRATVMSARKAADHLQAIADAAKPLARKQAVGPLSSFIAFLRERGDESAVDVVGPKPAPSRAAPVIEQPSDASMRAAWAALLRGAGTDRAVFAKVLAQLQADQTVKLDALNQIISDYTGSKRKAKSRKEALERARDHFEMDAQFEVKAAAIDKLTGSSR